MERRLPRPLIAPPVLAASLVLGAHLQGAGHPSELLRPLVVAMVGSGLVTLTAFVVLRRAELAAWVGLVATAWVLGREYAALWLLAGLVVLAWRYWARVHGRSVALPSSLLIAPPAVLAILAAWQLISGGVVTTEDFTISPPVARASVDQARPSIYVLLLDGYPRSDELARLAIDNGPFLTALEELGFRVSDEAHAHFGGTPETLASSMVASPDLVDSTRSDDLWAYMRELRRKYLVNVPTMDRYREAGYELHYVASEVGLSEWRGWDVTYDSGHLTDTEALLIQRSPLAGLLGPWVTDQLRDRADASLAAWVATSADGRQKLSFAHLIPPHLPLLWGVNGEAIGPGACWYERSCSLYTVIADDLGLSPDEYGRALGWQIEALNQRVRAAVSQVVARDPDAVVVLFSDHGARYEPFADEMHHTFLAARNAPPLAGPDGLFVELLEVVR